MVILAIVTIPTACTPKSNASDYNKTLNEDLSVFAEIWENNEGIQQTSAPAEAETSSSIEYSVEFNNETIFVTAFHTAINDWEYSVDKAVFIYDGITHTIPLGIEIGELGYNIIADDYNFDGFMDINFINYISQWVSTNDYIYLYNVQTKSYSLYNELSGNGSIVINSETQTIKQTKQVFSTGLEDYSSKSSEFKWENGELKLIRSENIEYDETLEMHIGTTRTLQNDGTWVEEKKQAKPLTP